MNPKVKKYLDDLNFQGVNVNNGFLQQAEEAQQALNNQTENQQ